MSITKINNQTFLKCPSCNNLVTAEQWDAYTLAECKNRVIRRDFKSIVYAVNKAKSKTRYLYKCPYCNEWSRAILIKPSVEEDNRENRDGVSFGSGIELEE